MQIITGKIPTAVKTVIYGPEGIGKSTLAAQWPEPLFIDTEGSTAHMDVRRLPRPDSWLELLNEVEWVRTHPDSCKTLVLDTADWAEALCMEHVCAKQQKSGIEEFGYGKGYTYAVEEFGRLLDALTLVKEAGIHVVVTAHALIAKFEQPDELGAYNRWALKLIDTPKCSNAARLKEWADMVLFARYETIVVNVDGKGAAGGKNKAQGGRRVIQTAHHPCWDAKNRFGLPEQIPMDFAPLAPIIDGSAAPHPAGASQLRDPISSDALRNRESLVAAKAAPSLSAAPSPSAGSSYTGRSPAEPATASRPSGGPSQPAAPQPAPPPEPEQAPAPEPAAPDEKSAEWQDVPEPLAKVMREAKVRPNEVKGVIADKGFYPYATPWSVITQNADFVNGWLMHPNVWPKVVEAVMKAREEAPF